MSWMEMVGNGMQGPGVRLLHFYGDLLWLVFNIICFPSIFTKLIISLISSSDAPFLFLVFRDAGTHAKPLEVSAGKIGLADPLSGNYETEFPNLGSLALEEKITQVRDESIYQSSLDAVVDDRKENGELSTSERATEKESKNTDSLETLVGCFKNRLFVYLVNLTFSLLILIFFGIF